MTDPAAASAPAGWYSAGIDGQERYWDGLVWTDLVRPTEGTVVHEQPQASALGTHPGTDSPLPERDHYASPTPANTSMAITPVPFTPPAAEEQSLARPWYRRKAIVIPIAILAGIFVVSGIGSAIGGNRSDDIAVPEPVASTQPKAEPATSVDVAVPDTTGLTAKEAQALIENAGLKVEFSAKDGVVLDRDNWTVLNTVPAAGVTAREGDTVVANVEKILTEEEKASAEAEKAADEAAKALATMPVAQQSAIRSAKSYLSMTGFSRAGLTQQLTSEYGEGYEPADAEAAIAYLESTGAVDWNAEAAQSAQSYLDMTGFSRQGLFDQLTSSYGEGFTPEQANYALDQVGL